MAGLLTSLLAVSAVIALALAFLAGSRTRFPGSRPFVGLMLAVSIWSAGYGAEISSTTPEAMELWLGFEYLGIPFLGVFWFFLVRELAGEPSLSQREVLALLSPGIVLCLLALTDRFHGWVHANLELSAVSPLPLLRFDRGPGYWLIWSYVWAGVLAGMVLLLRTRKSLGKVFHPQARILALAVVIPGVVNLAYTFDLVRPWGVLNLTPFSFTLSGLLLAWGVLRNGLFDLIGVARARVLEQMRDGVAVCDDQTRVVDFNPQATALLGPLRVGQSLAESPRVWPELAAALRAGNPARLWNAGGLPDARVLEATLTPLGPAAHRRGQMLLLHDVTDWVRVQAELQRRERLLTALAESARVLLQVEGPPNYAAFVEVLGRASGADRTYVFLNEYREDGMLCAAQVAEWCAPGVAPRQENPQLRHCPYDELGLTWWRQTLAAGETIHARVAELPAPERAVLEPQAIRAILVFPLQTERGFAGFVGFDNCHSEELWGSIEQEFLRNAALNLSLALRRHQLEAALRQSQKLEVVGRLSAGVTHEFNNLLQVVIGYAEMLRATLPAGEPAAQAAEQIYRAGLRAAALTGKLLAFTRRSPAFGRGCDLNAQLRDLYPLLARLLRKNLRLELRLEAAAPAIAVPPTHLEQIVFNLVTNARDAISGEGTITLSTRNQELDLPLARALELPPGRYTVLQVEDTGCGMSEEVRAHLFEPFFTTKPFGKGAGLGLATVHGLVRQYHGHIAVNSEVGRGSRFTLFFPTATPPAVTPAAPQPDGRPTVLVAEDDATVRRLLSELLARAGYAVLTAPDGETALEVLRRHPTPVHLLLSEVVVPSQDGAILVQRARQERPGLPALLLSRYPDDAASAGAELPPDVHLLPKPIQPETLLAKVHELLRAPARN
jgi:signal transduction histidine kinase/PAS domain-containing protein